MNASSHRVRTPPGAALQPGDAGPIASAAAARQDDTRQRTSELLVTVAHELRNPLDSLGNAVELLSLPGCDAAVAAEAACVARRQLAQMSQLINQLLDAGRTEVGRVALCMECVELQAVIADALETTAHAFSQRRHKLTLELPQEPIWIRADAMRCAQIFGNLLMNAAKYTPPGGRITVAAREEPGFARVRVADNGIGIAAEALEDVFDLFGQEERSGGLRQGGLGIGLAVVRRLVERHGGTVQAESRGEHMGSTFTVCLPLSAAGEGMRHSGPH